MTSKTYIILAAGSGSRISPHFNGLHKSLIPVNGISTLERNLEAIRSVDPTAKVVLVTGSESKQFSDIDVLQVHNPKWQDSGQIVSLLLGTSEMTGSQLIVQYADSLISKRNLRKLLESRAQAVVGSVPFWKEMWDMRFEYPQDDIESFQRDGNIVCGLGEKPAAIEKIQGQFSGTFLVNTDLIEVFEKLADTNPKISSTAALDQFIKHGGKLEAVDFEPPWYEVDTPRDWLVAEAICKAWDKTT